MKEEKLSNIRARKGRSFSMSIICHFQHTHSYKVKKSKKLTLTYMPYSFE
jgi:hypothetical protein